MNSSITVDNTTSSTVSQSDSVSCFTTKYTYDFETEDGLVQLESQLKKNTYINDEMPLSIREKEKLAAQK